ncbi:P-loop containing nucleoside triphosphate hydrolase protein [Marasmius fiardii PR-910]|nr:P-loop containing nucleoside triphosphate hydrolase protein [Marasmius fiardii PR-910]
MPKRRAVADSDDEEKHELGASPSSKRARTTEQSDDEESRQRRRVKKGKGKTRAEPEEDEKDEDVEMDDGEKIDEEAFESQYGKKVFEHLEAKRNKSGFGGIAEYGIIETIEMHQFMCHKSLKFTFGPNINFIIGHNGSGKSAVLSAITVALGGKTASTGRGSGLKAFIREGQQVAEVTISLKNQGEEAYKPEEYGKSIFITRRFTTQGGSMWKIKSKDGRVISSKKEELSAICDHMNIQVDNPMNVLTQDSARQFLSSSTPSEKYNILPQFFLRGTQLSQLSTEYETCLENINNTMKVLENKKSAIPDLEAAFKDASVRFEEASKAREQKQRIDDLKREKAWAHVAEKERELEAKLHDQEKQQRRLPKVQESLDKAQAQLQKAEAEVRRLEEEVAALGTHDELTERHAEAKQKLALERREIGEIKSDMREFNNQIKTLNMSITEMQQAIDQELQRMASNTQAKRDEYQRKLMVAKAAVAEDEEKRKEMEDIIRGLEGEVKQYQMEGQSTTTQLDTLRKRIEECQGMIQRCSQMESNRYVAYGNNISAVLQKIANTRWRGDRPLGPLGEFVKVKDGKKWSRLLRQQLGRYLTAFAVTNAQDQKALRAMLNESRNQNIMVIIYEKDLFDYSGGEPAADLPTVLRALDFSDEYVKRIFINQRSIERMLLGGDRREGEEILRRARGGHAWTADGFDLRRFPEGGGATNPLNLRTRNDNSELLLSERAADEKGFYEAELEKAQEEYKLVAEKEQQLRVKFQKKRMEIEARKREHHEILKRLTQAKRKLRAVEEEGQEETPEAEREKQSYTEQFKDVTQRLAEHEQIMGECIRKEQEIRSQIESFQTLRNEAVARTSAAAEERMKAQASIQHFEGKLKEEQRKLDAEKPAVETLQTEFQEWTNSALQYCERVKTTRKPEEIQKKIDSLQGALKKREKEQGYSLEDATVEVNKTKAKLDAAKKELKQMAALNKLLKASVMARMKRWQDFRLHIALRCRLVFTYNLSQRGYFGSIKFDHVGQELSLHVKTEDQASSSARDKEIHALSGGEKSFSTICLLLSLWESIGCPLRCLDEFDVFMDAVNRRISMKMMIDTANQSDKKQYVLITPQDMNNIHVGPTVRVHRMTDPERGQGVLAMS